jgi:hypothetical protein
MQTSYALDPAVGREGMIADSRIMKHFVSRLANGVIRAGKAVFRSVGFGQPGSNNRDPGSVYQNSVPAAAATVNAILATGGASSTSVQVVQGTALNGGSGVTADMAPARRVTLVLSNSANWLATNATLAGVNHLGQNVTELLAIPANGNVTLTSVGYFKRVTSLTIPVQGGAGGTYTIGVAILDSTVDITDFEGFAIYDASCDTVIFPNQNGVAEFRDSDSVSVMYKGALWVATENAVVAGQAAFVRIAAGAGGSQVGAARGDADTATAVVIPNARFLRDSGIGGLNILELY